MKDYLSSLKLESFVKLTGGTGIHIIIPIKRNKNFAQTKDLTQHIAKQLVKKYPDLFTTAFRKKSRHGKIFIDYFRNKYSATAVAPFSPRAKKHATIAVPFSWEKLEASEKRPVYTIQTIEDYFRDFPKNPWENFKPNSFPPLIPSLPL